jgi:hypothetical protein
MKSASTTAGTITPMAAQTATAPGRLFRFGTISPTLPAI